MNTRRTRHRSRTNGGPQHAGAIWTLAAAAGAGSLIIWWLALSGETSPNAPRAIAWPIIAACFVFGNIADIRFELRKASYAFDLSNAVLLPAMAFASPSRVFLAFIVGIAVYSAYARRDAIKTVLNASSHALAAAFALFVYHAILGGAGVASVTGSLAAVFALLTAEIVSYAAVATVVSLAQGGWFRPPDLMFLLEVVLDAALGLSAIFVLASSSGSGIVLVGLATLVGVEYVAHGRLRLRHARLRELYEFERSLASMVETDQVISAVLAEAMRLLHSGLAQLVVRDKASGSAGRTYTLRTGNSALRREDGLHPLVEQLGDDASVLLAPFTTRDPELQGALEACGFRDAIVLALEAEQEAAPAYLVVADRLGGKWTFGPRDIPMAETLTAPAAMALRSSSLLMKLREEIASKEHEATHDPLTGLANRILIGREIEAALAHRSAGALVGVMVVDMDDFKGVNDGFGHEAGDTFLRVIAERMVATVGERGHVGRLGGDEFAIVVPYARHPAELATLAADLDIAVRAPAEVDAATVVRRASIGVSIGPRHGSDRSGLLRAADLSMYLAKQRGGGVVVYSQSRDGELDRPSLLAALREAIATSSLDVNYQPKVALDTRKVVGVEALLRWTHPVLGPISPERFIPEAESSGLIRPLTRWVLATAIAQCSIWHQEGLDLHVAVNLSPTQMDDEEVVTQVEQLLEAHRLPPSCLVLEITESGALEDFPGDHAHVLEPLAALGVSLSIDDFGVGTSSLARIKNLPVSEIKIDKSFITDLGPDSVDGAIVASTINLAHQLGLSVVAEGVENAFTFRQLAALGCDVAQGYLMSVPLRPDDLGAWFRSETEVGTGGRHWETTSLGRLTSS